MNSVLKIVGEVLFDVFVFCTAVIVASGSCVKTGGFCGQAKAAITQTNAARPAP